VCNKIFDSVRFSLFGQCTKQKREDTPGDSFVLGRKAALQYIGGLLFSLVLPARIVEEVHGTLFARSGCRETGDHDHGARSSGRGVSPSRPGQSRERAEAAPPCGQGIPARDERIASDIEPGRAQELCDGRWKGSL